MSMPVRRDPKLPIAVGLLAVIGAGVVIYFLVVGLIMLAVFAAIVVSVGTAVRLWVARRTGR